MKTCLIVFFTIILIILLITYPLKIVVKFHINVLTQRAFYSIKFIFVKLLCGTAYIQNKRLIIQNSHNLIYNTQNKEFQTQLLKCILPKIDITKLQIYFSGGIANNAYQTAMICGYMYSITSAIFSYFITKNNFINVFQDIDPQYGKDCLDITTKAIVQFSLLDVIIAMLGATKKYKEILYEQNSK